MRLSTLIVFLLVAAVLSPIALVEDSDAQAPPVVLAVRILGVGENHFEISWETDVPTKGTVEWGKTKDYGESKATGSNFDTYHRINITGLTRLTEYHFKVVVQNVAGEVAQSTDHTITTGPQEELNESTPGWVWGITAVLIIVLLVYIFLLRPARQ
jgi:hypothetical protein